LDFGDDHFTIGSWEQKDFISKNGQMKLSTQVFFASIDQRSENGLDQASWVVKMFATEICNLPMPAYQCAACPCHDRRTQQFDLKIG